MNVTYKGRGLNAIVVADRAAQPVLVYLGLACLLYNLSCEVRPGHLKSTSMVIGAIYTRSTRIGGNYILHDHAHHMTVHDDRSFYFFFFKKKQRCIEICT